MRPRALDPDLLAAFVAVADHRSFTQAATALNLTQSAVSMQIRRLEDRVQAELFRRSTTHVALTDAGESLLGYARRILSLSDEAMGRLRNHGIKGRVRLGVMEDYGTHVVPPLLARFAASHPAISVEMETGLTSLMPERLGEDFDLVIGMHAEGSNSGQLLRHERAVWAGSAGHDVPDRTPLPLALYPQGCLFRKWAMDALDAAGRPWRLAFVSHSQAAVAAVVAQGLAVTVMKQGTFPSQLRPLSEKNGMPGLPVAEIRLHRAPNAPVAASLFADHLTASITP
ncbi:LysR family transcriptional regulator [Rhodopseudomonas boonkerdii]|nr:LysR substrate-binding domain-containing protein [Rhodopseudomonas boonkerdii]UGV28736.1 LysR family transcriptional regulator [Rhodopseudomonas boonkerdii]